MIYALISVIALQIVIHHFERKDLYSRIMSGSLTEYKRDDKPPKQHISAHKRALRKWRGGDEN